MKTILFILTLSIVCTYISCNDQDNFSNDKQFSGQEKVDQLLQLFKSYGAELDPNVSDEDRRNMLLEADYKSVKDFLEMLKNGENSSGGFAYRNDSNTKTQKLSKVRIKTRNENENGNVTQDYQITIKGVHSAVFTSATTSMDITYNDKRAKVTATSVSSNPSCSWVQNNYPEAQFGGSKECSLEVDGTVTSYGHTFKFRMVGTLELYKPGGFVKEGKVTSFREIKN